MNKNTPENHDHDPVRMISSLTNNMHAHLHQPFLCQSVPQYHQITRLTSQMRFPVPLKGSLF